MEKNVNIIAADDKDRTDINLDNELGGIWGTNLPDNGGIGIMSTCNSYVFMCF